MQSYNFFYRQRWVCPILNGNTLILAIEGSSPPIILRYVFCVEKEISSCSSLLSWFDFRAVADSEEVHVIAGESYTDTLSSWHIHGLTKENTICSFKGVQLSN